MLWGKGNGLVDKDTGEIKIQVGSRGLGGGVLSVFQGYIKGTITTQNSSVSFPFRNTKTGFSGSVFSYLPPSLLG